MTTAIILTTYNIESFASDKVTNVLPQAGITYVIGSSQVSLASLQDADNPEVTIVATDDTLSCSYAEESEVEISYEDTTFVDMSSSTSITDDIISDITNATGTVIQSANEIEQRLAAQDFTNLFIAQVKNYVNIYAVPDERHGEIVGKLYNKSVGTFIDEGDGWYRIQSGHVEGYVKSKYCKIGDDATNLVKEVGTRIATVNTPTLKVRSGPSFDDEVLGLVLIEDELIVTEELEGWVKVDIEEGNGYVSMDYVELSTEFVEAESTVEEETRLAKEQIEREIAHKAAQEAVAKAQTEKKKSDNNKKQETENYTPAVNYTTATSSMGSSVAQFALQFVGNPYVAGGTSLTHGADCSGFVMSVYNNFGIDLPHSSGADRSVGAAVDGIANAQPGDIVCYSGHVGIYIGNGQIVHASTAKTGIKVSDANYRKILAVRRIF